MSAKNSQVGGDHYSKLKIQPMEYSMANNLDACQHTAIKYITRFRQKGGIQDLEKAKHCIDMLIQFELGRTPTPDDFGQQNMWPESDGRMDVIGQNGNGGEHYDA